MRRWVVLLLLIPLIPSGATQESTWTEIAADPADVELTVEGADGVPMERFHGTDLRSLQILEEADGFTFQLDLEDPPADALAPEGEATHELFLRHGAVQYRALLVIDLVVEDRNFGRFDRMDASGVNEFLHNFDVQRDSATWTFTFHLPREWMPDEHAVIPQEGRSLEDLHVVTSAWRLITSCTNSQCTGTVEFSDRMPDTGFGVPFDVTFEGNQGETARLSSAQPLRASNGEAGTFVYNVSLHNAGSEAQTFRLDAENIPASWEVRLAEQVVRLDPGERMYAAVYATVPFAHQHGVTETFTLRMTGAPGDTATVDLGIDYLEVAQPAGHHNTLHIHSRQLGPFPPLTEALLTVLGASDIQGYMNTLDEDPASTGEKIPGQGSSIISVYNGEVYGTGFFWDVPLHPSLRLGLAFDDGAVGAYQFDLEAGLPMVEGLVLVRLTHSDGDKTTVLLSDEHPVPGVTTGGITVSGAIDFSAFDDLPPSENGRLELDLSWWDKRTTLFGADVLPTLNAGTMTLPLLEYTEALPPELSGGVAVVEQAPVLDAQESPKESPAPFLVLVPLLAMLRRRSF